MRTVIYAWASSFRTLERPSSDDAFAQQMLHLNAHPAGSYSVYHAYANLEGKYTRNPSKRCKVTTDQPPPTSFTRECHCLLNRVIELRNARHFQRFGTLRPRLLLCSLPVFA